MHPFFSKLLIDIRPAAQFNTPTRTTFFFLKVASWNHATLGHSRIAAQNLFPNWCHACLFRLHTCTLPKCFPQPLSCCSQQHYVAESRIFTRGLLLHVHISKQNNTSIMLGWDLCLISNSPILDSRTFYNLHHAWTTLLSAARERLLPKELFLSLIRVASITHDFSLTVAHLHISSSCIT